MLQSHAQKHIVAEQLSAQSDIGAELVGSHMCSGRHLGFQMVDPLIILN